MTDQTQPMPAELEDHLDDLMEGGATPPETVGGESVSTNPNEAEAEHESMAIADSDNEQDPGEQPSGA